MAGGLPVVTDETGRSCGVEAVVDKDFTAALLAITVNADRLLVLTDVAAVMAHFGTPQAEPLRNVDLDELADMEFPAGSMGPKIAALSAIRRNHRPTRRHRIALRRGGRSSPAPPEPPSPPPRTQPTTPNRDAGRAAPT